MSACKVAGLQGDLMRLYEMGYSDLSIANSLGLGETTVFRWRKGRGLKPKEVKIKDTINRPGAIYNGGLESLWQEVIRRAVMDAQGMGSELLNSNKHLRAAEYRRKYREQNKDGAMRFLSGGGNWNFACECIGQDPDDYSKFILEGLNGNRRTLKRDARKGGKRVAVGFAFDATAGQGRGKGKENASEGMEVCAV